MLQPRIGPNLAHLSVRLGLVFADSVFAAIDDGNTISEEIHFGLVESAIMNWATTAMGFRTLLGGIWDV